MDNAQQLANMGDYDWHVPSDTNTWSDQLYRIFGYEPQSRHMNYATYMEHCHPDDQEWITEVHQHSYRTGEPFRITHRIVRPDGEVRHLLCNGETVRDADGVPVRLRGTAIDITERVLAEDERERHAARAKDGADAPPGRTRDQRQRGAGADRGALRARARRHRRGP